MLKVPQGASLTRKEIDDYTNYVCQFGAKGLAYIKCNDISDIKEGLQSPILKFLHDDTVREIISQSHVQNGDVLFFGADKKEVVNAALGALRVKIGPDMKLVQSGWCPLWVVEFPMFEWDAEAKRWSALHHPFTAPTSNNPKDIIDYPADASSIAYDMF